MRKLIVFVCALVALVGFAKLAKGQVAVSGLIVENAKSEGLSFATVALLSLPDSQVVAGAISDESGRFTFQTTATGEHLIRVSLMGYEPLIRPIFIGEKNDAYDLGKLKLASADIELTTVEIEEKASTISGDLDKKSFDMDESIAQSGGSVLDAMKGLPGVTVDQEGKVMLRGSDKVLVLIDGQQSSLTGIGNQKGLDNLPAANIERIEIINNPSAKYDANGMAGIVNIIYKKEKQKGFNGEVGFTFGLGKLWKQRDDLPSDLGSYSLTPKYIPSLNLNYRTKKVNVFLQSQVFQRRKLPNNEFTTRFYDDGRQTASQVAENRTQIQTILNGGIDWFINENNTLTFSSVFDYEKHTDTSQVPFIDQLGDARYRYWHWRESEVTGYMNFRLNYAHKFAQPGHLINVSGQFTRGWEDEAYFLNDSSVFRVASDSTHIVAIENVWLANIDYTKPLPIGKLELGAMTRIRRLPVTYDIGFGPASIIYTGLGDRSDWGENIYGGYANFLLEKKKYEIEAGVRLEHTSVFYTLAPENIYYDQNDAYQYFQVYPNARFTWRINDRNLLSLFYNRRVTRPGEPELRIFPKFDDPELLKVGNPYLRPQFTQTAELAYKHILDKASIFISAYYRNHEKPFLRIYSQDTSATGYAVINKIYQNVGAANEWGTEIIISVDPFKWWKLNGNFNLWYNQISPYTGLILFPYSRTFDIPQSNSLTYGFKVNSNFDLPYELKIQLSGQYLAPVNIPQGRQLSRFSLDLGIQKAFLEGKLLVTLSGTDLLNTYGLRQEFRGDGFTAIYQNFYETQVLRLGARYKF